MPRQPLLLMYNSKKAKFPSMEAWIRQVSESGLTYCNKLVPCFYQYFLPLLSYFFIQSSMLQEITIGKADIQVRSGFFVVRIVVLGEIPLVGLGLRDVEVQKALFCWLCPPFLPSIELSIRIVGSMSLRVVLMSLDVLGLMGRSLRVEGLGKISKFLAR